MELVYAVQFGYEIGFWLWDWFLVMELVFIYGIGVVLVMELFYLKYSTNYFIANKHHITFIDNKHHITFIPIIPLQT